MLTLATSHPSKVVSCINLKSKGFTLLEMLVVLVIGGLLVSIAAPRFQKMVSSFDATLQRDNVIGLIEGLGYRAFSEGKPIMLTNTPVEDASSPPAVVPLPPGWKIKVDQPIEYTFNGICRGGSLTITSPEGIAEVYRLEAPLCRLVWVEK